MQMPDFLAHLKETASSPYAFVAYICVVAAWVYVLIARHRLKTVAGVIRDLPKDKRAEVILREYSTTPRAGLSAEQWIRSRRQTLLFLSFLATLIAVIAVIGITFSRKADVQPGNPNGASTTPNNNNKPSETPNDDITPLEGPVDVTNPSPTPNNKNIRKPSRKSSNSASTRDGGSVEKARTYVGVGFDGEQLGREVVLPAGFQIAPLSFTSIDGSTLDVSERQSQSRLKSSVELVEILEGHSHSENVRVFDITLANKSMEQRLLKDFVVKWDYSSGGGANNEKPYLLRPTAKYKIIMPIELEHPRDEKTQCVCPHIVIPHGTKADPNLVTIRLYLMYTIAYHPYTGWDIWFSLDITDEKGGSVSIFSKRRWKDRPYKDGDY